jgi:hypothetical protein
LAVIKAFPYTFIVVETWACRMSFCCTPIGAPVLSSQERNVWRKVCHPTHRHKLAIRGSKTGISAIGSKHEPVARSHVNRLPLMHGKRARLCWGKASLLTVCIASDHRAHIAAGYSTAR